MTHPSDRRAAAVILGLFVILGLGYSVLNPVFEAPDEVYHYPYVKHLADGRGLPVQRVDQEAAWEQEGSQPPLYYALAAALTSWIDTDDLALALRLNPHARIGVPLAQDNKNMVIHTDREDLPWRGTVLAVHLIRFFSVLLGAVAVACTYFLSLRLFPDNPAVATGAVVLNALNPMFPFIGGSVNNDNLVILLSSVSLLMLMRVVQRRGSTRYLVLLGALIGLACLSKLSALGLIPLAALALAIQHVRERRLSSASLQKPSPAHPTADPPGLAGCLNEVAMKTSCSSSRSPRARTWWHELAIWASDSLKVFIPVLLVAGWWYLRNWRLYGEPLGVRTMLDLFGRRSTVPTLSQLLAEFEGFRISFWGLFGVVNVLLRPHWLYKVLDALTIFACIGLILWFMPVCVRRQLPDTWPLLLLAVGWIAIVCASLIRWTAMTKASQGRLVFPAMSAICPLLTRGILAWFPRRHWSRVVHFLAIPLGLLAITAPFTAILPAYASPPILDVEDVPSTAQPFEATYGDVVRLAAYEIGVPEVHPGDSLPVTLYWESLAPMSLDYSIYIHLFGWQGQRLGQRDSYPGGGGYPTSLWSPGQVIRDTYLVDIRPDAIGPIAAEIEVGLYHLDTMKRLPAVDAHGNSVGKPVLGRVKIAVPTQASNPVHALDVNLDNRVRLIGYDLAAESTRPGEVVPLTLYWHVVGELERDYTVFVHLLDGDEDIVGQGDGPPMENAYPTSFWDVGEELADGHSLAVSPDARPGPCRVFVGLYDPETGRRLPILGPEGEPTGDAILLASILVSDR